MSSDHTPIQPEDYVEPRCLLCGEPFGSEPPVKPVPQQRIIEKVDEYMSRRDYAAVERHLLYWLEEARLGRDLRGELMIRNELVGHYRKTANKERALENASKALELLERMGFTESVSAGTTYTNVATAYQAFGKTEESLPLFEKALKIYESDPHTAPSLLGGLYNNMALTCVELKRFDQAFTLYEKALNTMASVPGGRLEQAITYLNMADAAAAKGGMPDAEPEVFAFVDKAADLLDDPQAPEDGYYAFVCEKCAPTFSYYGYFIEAEKLEKKANAIYQRT